MFEEMMQSFNEEAAEFIFRFQPVSAPRPVPRRPLPSVPSGEGSSRTKSRVGRNDPCPCGSGKKYKKCCGKDL